MTSYHNEVIVSTMQAATDTKVCQFIIVGILLAKDLEQSPHQPGAVCLKHG